MFNTVPDFSHTSLTRLNILFPNTLRLRANGLLENSFLPQRCGSHNCLWCLGPPSWARISLWWQTMFVPEPRIPQTCCAGLFWLAVAVSFCFTWTKIVLQYWDFQPCKILRCFFCAQHLCLDLMILPRLLANKSNSCLPMRVPATVALTSNDVIFAFTRNC